MDLQNSINALEEAKIVEQNVLREEFFHLNQFHMYVKILSKISIIPDDNYKVNTIVDYKTSFR